MTKNTSNILVTRILAFPGPASASRRGPGNRPLLPQMFQTCADFYPFDASGTPEWAIALNYKDSIRMARAHGYEAMREAAMAAFAKTGGGRRLNIVRSVFGGQPEESFDPVRTI
jgi:hypothetical protein